MSKYTDPLQKPVHTCPKCGAVKQPLSNGIPHYCRETRTYWLVRVDNDPLHTYAGKSLLEALELAQMDPQTPFELGTVIAFDAGEARLCDPDRWTRIPPQVIDSRG